MVSWSAQLETRIMLDYVIDSETVTHSDLWELCMVTEVLAYENVGVSSLGHKDNQDTKFLFYPITPVPVSFGPNQSITFCLVKPS